MTVEGVVVGDYEGPSPALRGFYVQQADATVDADPATSEGVFVYNGSSDSVTLGDVVSVTGTVGEYQGQTQVSTLTALSVLSSGATVTPATVAMPFASATAAEAYEGMLVSFPQPLYVTEFYQQARSGEVVLSSGAKLQQPTAVAAPGAAAQAIQAANDLNRITIDDATNAQNADPVFAEGGNPLSASNPLRGGDTVTGLVGVMTYTWGGYSSSPNTYRVRPIGDLSDSGLVAGGVVPFFAAANPRPVAPDAVGGTLKVASFNVLNYFQTLDTGAAICGPVGNEQECRGAENAVEFERQRTKLIAALGALDADVIALMELENTPGVDPAADLAAGLNAAQGITGWESVNTGMLGTDVIRVGIVFRGDKVRPAGDFTVMDSTVDPRFDDTSNRPSLGQTFVQMNGSEHVTLVVNHLKSKGSCPGDGSANDDHGDGAGCWNETRTQAAQALVDWIAAGQAGNGDPDVVLMGDMNSYAMEDPIRVFADAGYTDLSLGGYSYVFDGQWGYLDYALASASLLPQVTGVTEFHINSDEVPVLDYNTNFKSAAQIANLYAPDMYRTSDHDPVLLGMNLDSGVSWA
ncbi:MAG: ExeM/NucH family extracellular endonuclease, partial [Demequinaceae bacterium]|nr:ExeM/NucH family extracellular endonuclease [Demequinaceae bacterium]